MGSEDSRAGPPKSISSYGPDWGKIKNDSSFVQRFKNLRSTNLSSEKQSEQKQIRPVDSKVHN